MNIGIVGAPLSNSNLGCVALCYSLISVLEIITKKHGVRAKYYIFEDFYNELKYEEAAVVLGVDKIRIIFAQYGTISTPLRILRNIPRMMKMLPILERCELVIDMTAGDAFSDIYGDIILRGRTNIKVLIENKGIPILLGPQTYGPYYKKENKRLAIKAIKNANIVMSRDMISTEVVKDCGRENVITATDMAFFLPYEREEKGEGEIRVGVNISSMLWFSHKEMAEQRFSLRCNYQYCIEKLISIFLKNSKCTVYLIPHVLSDCEANNVIKKRFPQTVACEFFSNPVEAKKKISSMDFFIGSRMHACIAAFASGVPCIPLSYSRKFDGLFNNLGYDEVINLCDNTDEMVISVVIDRLYNYEILKSKIKACDENLSYYKNVVIDSFDKFLFHPINDYEKK